jgi:hypothetical protein
LPRRWSAVDARNRTMMTLPRGRGGLAVDAGTSLAADASWKALV